MILGNPSLMTRIIVGKTLGFIFGLSGAVAIALMHPETTWMLRLAVVFWYTTLGALIAVFGVLTWHPILKISIPWWLRSSGIGAWMNLLIVMFAHAEIQAIMTNGFGVSGVWSSPFWLVLEGAVVGLVIGFAATQLGGEGKATVDEPLARA